MDDVINRKDAIGAILSVEPIAELSDGDAVIRVSAANYVLGNLPSAQSEPHYDEWCDDCKEYDKERHCCPRWNKVIRETLKDAQPERKTGKWMISETAYDDTEAKCSECGFVTLVNEPGNGLHMLSDLRFCPNCGADMRMRRRS